MRSFIVKLRILHSTQLDLEIVAIAYAPLPIRSPISIEDPALELLFRVDVELVEDHDLLVLAVYVVHS